MKVLLGQFFESNIGALTRKVLGAAGIGLISFAGVKIAFDAVLLYTKNQYNSLPVDALNLAGLAGIGEAFGIITGALLYRIVFVSSSKLGVIPK